MANRMSTLPAIIGAERLDVGDPSELSHRIVSDEAFSRLDPQPVGDALSTSRHGMQKGALPGSVCVTHDQVLQEPFFPFVDSHVAKRLSTPFANQTGVVALKIVDYKKDQLGGADPRPDEVIAVVDSHWVNGAHHIERRAAEANLPDKKGRVGFSPYEQFFTNGLGPEGEPRRLLTRHGRFLWERVQEENIFGGQWDWKLRGISVPTEAGPGDIISEGAIPLAYSTANGRQPFEYQGGFFDAMSYEDGHGVDKSLLDPSGHDFTKYVNKMRDMMREMPDDDDIFESMDPDLEDHIRETIANVNANSGIGAARVAERAAKLRAEIDEIITSKHHLSPEGMKNSEKHIQRLIQSTVSAYRFLQIHKSSYQTWQMARAKAEMMHMDPEIIQPLARVELVAFDDIDSQIVAELVEVISAQDQKHGGDKTYLRNIIDKTIKYMGGRTRKPNETLAIKALDKNRLRFLTNLAMGDSAAAGESHGRRYTETNMGTAIQGSHYCDEVITHTLNPGADPNPTDRFPRGHGMSGIDDVFDLVTPERDATGMPFNRYMSTDTNSQPAGLTNLLDEYYDGRNHARDFREIFEAGILLSHRLGASHKQTWGIEYAFPDARGVPIKEVHPSELANGSVFELRKMKAGATASTGDGGPGIFSEFGKIPGQEPMNRGLVDRRDKSNEKPVSLRDITYEDGSPEGIARRRKSTVLIGSYMVNGTYQITDPPGDNAVAMVARHFREFVPTNEDK